MNNRNFQIDGASRYFGVWVWQLVHLLILVFSFQWCVLFLCLAKLYRSCPIRDKGLLAWQRLSPYQRSHSEPCKTAATQEVCTKTNILLPTDPINLTGDVIIIIVTVLNLDVTVRCWMNYGKTFCQCMSCLRLSHFCSPQPRRALTILWNCWFWLQINPFSGNCASCLV